MTLKPPVILFAERNLAWSRRARLALRRRGATVFRETDLEGALQQAAAFPPDLVVLDEDLEGREERDLVEMFQTALPEAEIILLESQAPDSPHGIGRGLLYSGMKPIAESTLLQIIEEGLPGRLRQDPAPQADRQN